MTIANEIQRLHELHQSGALSADEFAQAKARLLATSARDDVDLEVIDDRLTDPRYLSEQTKLWAMLLHLSCLAGYVVPLGGFVIPIVIWQLKKDELPELDEHGKNAVNWIISHLIWVAACVLLAFVGIGIPLLFLLALVSVVFPLVAAIKASNGEVWPYPITISFF